MVSPVKIVWWFLGAILVAAGALWIMFEMSLFSDNAPEPHTVEWEAIEKTRFEKKKDKLEATISEWEAKKAQLEHEKHRPQPSPTAQP
jgi:hypothetical protein